MGILGSWILSFRGFGVQGLESSVGSRVRVMGLELRFQV